MQGASSPKMRPVVACRWYSALISHKKLKLSLGQHGVGGADIWRPANRQQIRGLPSSQLRLQALHTKAKQQKPGNNCTSYNPQSCKSSLVCSLAARLLDQEASPDMHMT